MSKAGEMFLEHPMETPFAASWNRVQSALPEIFDDIREAVAMTNNITVK